MCYLLFRHAVYTRGNATAAAVAAAAQELSHFSVLCVFNNLAMAMGEGKEQEEDEKFTTFLSLSFFYILISVIYSVLRHFFRSILFVEINEKIQIFNEHLRV
jgi:hypothetical protein